MKINYAELINCSTAEEVQNAVRKWSSDKSDKEHLIRSAILDIHANIEELLKQILFWHMMNILFQDGNKNQNEKRQDKLESVINNMNFMAMYKLLEPCLDAFPSEDLKYLGALNKVRNLAAHGLTDKVFYKGRNPFKDHDALAQIFVEGWAARQELKKFYERMIEDPKAISKRYYEFYQEHN